MPELPEVETIWRGLLKYLIGKTVKDVVVNEGGKVFGLKEADVFLRKIQEIRRFGKALVIDFSGGISVMIHLRMTGQLIYRGEEDFAGGHPNENFVAELPNKQTRAIFIFSDETKLFFNDQRKFGFVKFIETEKVKDEEFIRKLAKEPWEMTGEDLYQKLQKKKVTIKAILLDQTIICGLGNIYTDETLFMSGVRPETRADKISLETAKKIIENARMIMERSIELGGSTIKNYVNADGTRGNYLDKFAQVYGREGEKCVKCGGKIMKTRVAGRGTYYCEVCQK